MFADSHAFMSGVSKDKDGGASLQIVKGTLPPGPPSVNINAGYGILRNTTNKDIRSKYN